MRLLIYTQVVDKEDPILGFFHSWIETFSQQFETVEVICLKKGTYTLPQNVTVKSLGKEEGKNRLVYVFRFYSYFFDSYIRRRVDFVFFHMGAIANVLAFPFFIMRRLRRTRFYWWKTHGKINMLGRLALRVSDRVYTAVPESFPIRSRKRKVVGHAIDTNVFVPNGQTPAPVLLFVGRISRIKRIEQVIEVASLLRDRGVGLLVRIVGAVTDDAYAHELQCLVAKLQLEDVVTFVGGMNQQELVAEYQQASILMNPSDTDGLDKVVLEAMACGVVPVTANLSFKAMLSPYDLFVKKGDIEAYASRIRSIGTLDANVRQDLCVVLRNIVVEDHALGTLTTRIFGSV